MKSILFKDGEEGAWLRSQALGMGDYVQEGGEMNFVKAVKEANKGKRIRLSDWNDGRCVLRSELFLVWDKTWENYTPTVLSILRDDWEVVE